MITINSNRIRILIISIAHLCHDIFTSFLSPLLPLLIQNLRLTYTSAGFLSVLMRLPSLMNPIIGAYADRIELKFIVIISPTITAIAMCLIGVAPNYFILGGFILIAGISSSCFHVPAPILLKQFGNNRIGTAMSSFQIGGELARTLGPMIVLGAVSFWGLDGLYRLIPLGMLMSYILYKSFRNVPKKERKPSQHNIRGSILSTINEDRRMFLAIFGILLTKALTATLLVAFLPTYLMSIGESLWFSGSTLSILQASAVVGVLMTGTLSDRVGCVKMLRFLTIATPFIMLFLVYSKNWSFIIGIISIGIIGFSGTPVILALIQKRGFLYPSIANGIYMTLNFMLSSIMILFAGKLADLIDIQSMFYSVAFCSFIGIPFVFLLKPKFCNQLFTT